MKHITEYQTDEAWELCKHLPVKRNGYKHIDNEPNTAYRLAELHVWKSAYEKKPKLAIDAVWRVGNYPLMKALTSLDSIRG
jgi:hypothetical protein